MQKKKKKKTKEFKKIKKLVAQFEWGVLFT
jgi:hypothetical protein